MNNRTTQFGFVAIILAFTALFIWNEQRSPEIVDVTNQSCEEGENDTHVCAILNLSTNPDAKPQWLKKCEINADCTTTCAKQPGMCVQDQDTKDGVGVCFCP